MELPGHIVILTHELDRFETGPYFMRQIAAVWREEGWRVTVLTDPRARVDADLAILHVDLTVIPPEYLEFMAQYPITINRGVADISKRRISSNIVRRGDGYQGPVVVKTNRNCGGLTEARHLRGSRLLKRFRKMRDKRFWRWRTRLASLEYPIFPSADQVPRGVWVNPELIVERFLPERREEFYCLRTWIFLGDRETHMVSYAIQPIVKSENTLRRKPLDEVPAELRAIRRELGFDFGKFDYAMVDGRVILYDVNRTPSVGSLAPEVFLPRARHYAEGIRAFFPDA